MPRLPPSIAWPADSVSVAVGHGLVLIAALDGGFAERLATSKIEQLLCQTEKWPREWAGIAGKFSFRTDLCKTCILLHRLKAQADRAFFY